MDGPIAFAHNQLARRIESGDTVVDATAGNGHDTLFLARKAARVFAFDIQREALEAAQGRIEAAGLANVTFIRDSHVNIPLYVAEPIKAAGFNLGYLPGSTSTVTTKAETSVEALRNVLEILVVRGVLSVTLYPGHEEGEREAQAVEKLLAELDGSRFNVFKYLPLNKKKAPYTMLVEKKGAKDA